MPLMGKLQTTLMGEGMGGFGGYGDGYDGYPGEDMGMGNLTPQQQAMMEQQL